MEPIQAINLGIIGSGKVTTQRHIPSVRSLGDAKVKLLAVADLQPGLADSVARGNEIPYAFSDYRDLLAMAEINAVSICTPTPTHAAIAIAALKAGKHVYLEKPVTVNETEMREVLEVAQANDKVLLAGSNGLLQGQMQVIKKLITDNVLGEVYTASITRMAPRNAGDNSRKTSGEDGVIYDSASHGVEWVLYLLNDPIPVAVTAIEYYKYDNLSLPVAQRDCNEVEDALLTLIQFDNGSSFLYKVMRSVVTPWVYELNVHGDKGSIKYDVSKCYKEKSDDCFWLYTQDSNGLILESKPMMKYGRTHAAMYEHFFDCLRRGQASLISNGVRSLVVMKVLDAIRRSVKNHGQQVIIG
jgi:predicted dehydrogenase